MTEVDRVRSGENSLVSATALGMTLPNPRPVSKRSTSRLSIDCADAVNSDSTPNTSMPINSTGRRPKRSASGPPRSAPSIRPIRLAENTGANAARLTWKVLTMAGAT